MLEDRTLLACPPVCLTGDPVWMEQGPGPIIDDRFGELPAMGAVQALAAHPQNANVLFAGTVNGGVWRTYNATDAMPAWTPLTDQLPSLAIGALALSPLAQDGTEFDQQTPLDELVLYAGLGSFTHSAYKGQGVTGGILKTTDGGEHWSLFGHDELDGLRVTSVVPTATMDTGSGAGRGGQVVYVATDVIVLEFGSTMRVKGGVFISRDGAQSFTQISGDQFDNDGDGMVDEPDEGHVLPAGPVNHLVPDWSNPGELALYGAIAGDFDKKQLGGNEDKADNDLIPWSNKGIYRGAGTNWAAVAGTTVPAPSGIGEIDRALKIKLATDRASGVVYAGVISRLITSDGEDQGQQLARVIRSADSGANWTAMPLPSTNFAGVEQGLIPGGQGDFSVAVDPADPNVIYAAGDRQENPLGADGCRNYVGRVFRGVFATGAWQQIVCGNAGGVAPHPDTRDMVFDANGDLLQADDGGIYRHVRPQFEIRAESRFIEDGSTIQVNGTVLEFDSGPELDPRSFSDQLDDGDTFTITDDSGVNAPVTFEFEDTAQGDGVAPGHVAIPFSASALGDELRLAITAAINGVPRSEFTTVAVTLTGDLVLLHDTALVDSVTQGDESAFVTGGYGVAAGHLKISFERDFSNEQLATAVIDAVNNGGVGTQASYSQSPDRIAFTGHVAIASRTLALQGVPAWVPVLGNLRISEMYSVAYDHLNHVIFAGMQDTGSAEQSVHAANGQDDNDNSLIDEAAERFPWKTITLGDGNTQAAAVVDVSSDGIDNDDDGLVDAADTDEVGIRSLRFSLNNDLSVWFRNEFNGTGELVHSPNEFRVKFFPADSVSKQQSALIEPNCYDQDGNTSFFPLPYALNTIQPSQILLGFNGLYASDNGGGHFQLIQGQTDCSLPDVTAVAYGGREPNLLTPEPDDLRDMPDVTYVARGSEIHVRSKSDEAFTKYAVPGAARIRDIALDSTNWRTAYAVDQTNVYMTTDAGATWTPIGNSLAPLLHRHYDAVDLRSVLFVNTPDHDVLLVGGLGGVYRAIDPAANSEPVWTKLGANFPNLLVADLAYNEPDDFLLAATVGRGAWGLRNARAQLDSPVVLTISADTASSEPAVKLARDPGNPLMLNVFVNGTLAQSVPLPALQSIEIVGSNLDDTLTIDSRHGVIDVPLGIHFDGAGGTANALILEGIAGACQWRNDGPDGAGAGLNQISDASPVSGDTQVQTVQFERLQVGPGSFENILPCLRDGQQQFGDLPLNQPALLARNLPVFGPWLGRALDGISLASVRARIDPVPGAAKALDGDLASGSHVLRRLFESGMGAFALSEIGSSIATPDDLRAALDALDEVPGNVILSQSGGVTRYDVQVLKTLGGKVDLDVDAAVLNGTVRLRGSLDMSADVALHIVLGVDSLGFFIDADHHAAPELTVGNIQITGDVQGSGRFGFLAVNLTDAALTVDPAAMLSINLREPGPDPFTGQTDGMIRLYELGSAVVDLATGALQGNPSGTDMVLTGTLNVAAVLPNLAAPFELVDARVRFTWADIANAGAVEVTADTAVGQGLFDFLHVTPEQVLMGLNKTGVLLDKVREKPSVMSTEIPFTHGTRIGEVVNVADAFRQKVTALVESSSGTTTFSTVQDLAYALSLSLGISPPELGIEYDPATHDLTYHVDFEHSFEPIERPVAFAVHAGTLAGFETESTIGVAAEVDLQLDFGVNLVSAVTDAALERSFFIRDVTLAGSVSVTADDIDATANLGSLAVDLLNGTAAGLANITIPFTDPGSDAPDGRISLAELATLDLDALLGSPTTLVAGSFNLPVSIDPFHLGGVMIALSGFVSGTHEQIDYSLTAAVAGNIVSGLVIEPLLDGSPSTVTFTKATGLAIHARGRILGVAATLEGAITAAGDFSFAAETDEFDIGSARVRATGNVFRSDGAIDWNLCGTVLDWKPVPFLTVERLDVTIDPTMIGFATTASIAGVSGLRLAGDFQFSDKSYAITADAETDWEPLDGVHLRNVLFGITNRNADAAARVTARADLDLFDTHFIVSANVTAGGEWIAAQPTGEFNPIPGLTIHDTLIVATTYELVLDVGTVPAVEVTDPPAQLSGTQRRIPVGVNLVAAATLPENIPVVGGAEVQIAGHIGTALADLSIEAKLVLAHPPEIAGLFAFDAVGLRITGAPSLSLFGQGRVLHERIPSLEQDIGVEAALTLDLVNTTLSGSLSLLRPADGSPPISNLFGVDGLNILEGDGEFGINFATTPLPLPTIGFNLVAALPDLAVNTLSLPRTIGAALNISTTEPIFAIRVIDWRPFHVLGIDDVVIDEGSIVAAPNGGSIGAKVFPRGFSAAFEADILGTHVSYVGVFSEETQGIILKGSVSTARLAGITVGGRGCDGIFQDGVDNGTPQNPDPDADNGACFNAMYSATNPLNNGFTADFTIDLPGPGGLLDVHGEFSNSLLVLDATVTDWRPIAGLDFDGALHAEIVLKTASLELDFDLDVRILGAMTHFEGTISTSPSGFAIFAAATIDTALVELTATIDLGANSPFAIGLAATFELPGSRRTPVQLTGEIGAGGVAIVAMVDDWQLVPGLSFDGSLEIDASLQTTHLVVSVDVSTHMLGSRLTLEGTIVAGSGGLTIDLSGAIEFGGRELGGVGIDLEVDLVTQPEFRLDFHGEMELFAGFRLDVSAEVRETPAGFAITVAARADVPLPNLTLGPLTVDLEGHLTGSLSFGSRPSDFSFSIGVNGRACVSVDNIGTACTGEVSATLSFDGTNIEFPKWKPHVHTNRLGIPTRVHWHALQKPAADTSEPRMTVTVNCTAADRRVCGTIEVRGSAAPEFVQVVEQGSTIIVRSRNSAGEMVTLLERPKSNVTAIDVELRGGNDTIDLAGSLSQRLGAFSLPAVLRGGSGRDVIFGGTGPNTIFGGDGGRDAAGRGIVFPGLGIVEDSGDQLVGNSANDSIFGEGGNDVINGAGGVDLLDGGAGVDIINGRLVVRGTDRPEQLMIARDVLIETVCRLDRCFEVTVADDIVVRSARANTPPVTLGRFATSGVTSLDVDARGGDDRIEVASNLAIPGVLHGGSGDDVIVGGGGFDAAFGDAGIDLLIGGSGDVLDGGSAANLTLVAGQLHLIGTAHAERIDLSKSGELLRAQVIDNEDGEAAIFLIPLTALSAVQFDLQGGNDSVTAAAALTIPADFALGSGDDIAQAGGGSTTMHGGDGDDELHGGPGNDAVHGDAGNDTITCGGGVDELVGGPGVNDVSCGGNHPPTLDPIGPLSVDEGGTITFAVTATDPDTDSTDDPPPVLVGPLPYLSQGDSPFGGSDFVYFHLENFEDGVLDVPGVAASAGSVVSPGDSPPDDRPPGMVGWWRAEGDASDSANGNDGALQNGAGFIPGKIGEAFSFDGTNDEIVIAHHADQNTGGQITIDAWIYSTSSGHGRPILQKRSVSNIGGFTLETTHAPFGPSNGLQLGIWVGGALQLLQTPADVLQLNAWHHVAATFDQTKMRIYVDGIERARTSLTATIDAVSDPLVIGRNVAIPSFAWQGAIDEIGLFNRALSAPEIEQIARGGRTSPRTIYRNEFEGTPGSEWSATTTDITPTGTRRFLGQFGSETVSLSLGDGSVAFPDGLPVHDEVTISFDLFVIRTWDGNGTGCHGPDVWDLSVAGGPTLLHTTFNNPFPGCESTPQAYPEMFPGGMNPFRSGAEEVNSLGFTFLGVPGIGVLDSVYHLSFSFPHTASFVRFDFAGMLSTPGFDESWGLDNVTVSFYVAGQTTYSVGGDFSRTTNPLGAWSYGWAPSRGGTYHLYPRHFETGDGRRVWDEPSILALGAPSIVYNGSNSVLFPLGFPLQPGEVVYHPGQNGENGVVRWTAPAPGVANIAALFSGFDGATTDVAVIHSYTVRDESCVEDGDEDESNDCEPEVRVADELFAGDIMGRGDRESFMTTIDVEAGDTIDFTVGHGGNGFFFDSTRIDATILFTSNATSPGGGSDTPDSVDFDDGAIDGDGRTGHSFKHGSAADGITFTFDAALLGGLPTHVGMVWTDGGAPATGGGLEADILFEAFDAAGNSLGVLSATDLGDADRAGATAEDRFFGAVYSGGIAMIKISDSDGGPIEVDHLQFGRATPPVAAKLSFSLDPTAPAGAAIDPNTGAFTWTPTETQGPGTFSFSVRVTDNGTASLSHSQVVTITVNEVNEPPVLASIANRTVTQGQPIALTAAATDPDVPGNRIDFSLDSGAPPGAAIDARTGEFSWTPQATLHPLGDYEVTIRVTDRGSPALSSSQTFTIAVTADNTPPTFDRVKLNANDRFITGINLVASESLHPLQAANVANYRMIGAGADRILGTKDDVAAPPASATYDDATQTVRLTPAGGPNRINLNRLFQVIVLSPTAAGLSDLAGNALDGDRNGTSGGEFRFDAARVTNSLSYRTRAGDDVTLTITRAVMDLLLDAGEIQHMSLHDGPGVSTLTGRITRRNLNPGVAAIRLITGTEGLSITLPSKAFHVGRLSPAAVDDLLVSGELIEM